MLHSLLDIFQVRKSHSLRSPSSTFKPSPASNGSNPYAQPIRNRKQQPLSAPPIPDPDYSLSENESDTEPITEQCTARVQVAEGSGGSSSSGSLPHSFSVDEIQKVNNFFCQNCSKYFSVRFFLTVGIEFFNPKNMHIIFMELNSVPKNWGTVIFAFIDSA